MSSSVFEDIHLDYQDQKAELESLRHQLTVLKEMLQRTRHPENQPNPSEIKEIERLKQRLEKISQALHEKTQQIASFKQEDERLRQTILLLREKNSEAQRVLTENEQLKEKCRLQEMEIKKLQDQYALESMGRTSANEEVEILQAQFITLKEKCIGLDTDLKNKEAEKTEWQQEKQQLLDQIEQWKVAVSEAEKKEQESQVQVQRLQDEKQQQIEILERAVLAKEEAEARLKMAQQHLAKKVRETTDLTDKVHEQQKSIQEFTSQLEAAQEIQNNLQKEIDRQQESEKGFQEQIDAAHSFSDSLRQHWEEKYNVLHETLTKSEARIEELQSLEEKITKAEQLWSEMGKLLKSELTPPLLRHHLNPFD